MTEVATALHLVLPPLSILATGRLAKSRGIVWTVVAGLALYESALLVFGLLLGYLGRLRAPWPLAFWCLAVLALLGLAAWGARAFWNAARAGLASLRPRPGDVFLGLGVLTTAYLVGLQIARDWTEGATAFDSLSYHIPRVLQWAWHGSFRPWPTAVWQQVGLPAGGDVVLLPGVLLGIGWLGGAWTTVWLSLGAAAAVFAASRGLGAGPRPSFVAALAFLSFPAVGPRLADVNSDMAAAFPLLAAWVLTTRARSLREGAFLFPALCGVGVACKANVAPAALVLAVALFGRRFRAVLADRRAVAAAAGGTLFAALVCAGSYLPVRRLFGDFVGGGEGRVLISYLRGPAGVARAISFGVLHWAVEPLALVPEPPRFNLLDAAGVNRLYDALGAGTRESWYPAINPETNRSGVFPLLALPWLLAALPRRKRVAGALLYLALLLALFAPLNPNCYASRFAVVLLAAFAVLWGMAAARSPALVTLLTIASLAVEARYLRWRDLPHLQTLPAPDRNARIAAAVGSHTLWLLSGSLSVDAQIAGRHADVRFEYLACPPDGDWVRLLAHARQESPWLLLNDNSPDVATGPGYESAFGRPCPNVPVSSLQGALEEAGWQLAFEEYGFQVWNAATAGGPDEPK